MDSVAYENKCVARNSFALATFFVMIYDDDANCTLALPITCSGSLFSLLTLLVESPKYSTVYSTRDHFFSFLSLHEAHLKLLPNFTV